MKINWKDIGIRALKTFVQAFLGIVIPEIIVILNGGFVSWSTAWAILAPFVASALAAGISAVWNSVIHPIMEAENNGNSN